MPAGRCVRDVAFAYRLREGRIAERWAIRDDLAMLQQLGAEPAVQGRSPDLADTRRRDEPGQGWRTQDGSAASGAEPPAVLAQLQAWVEMSDGVRLHATLTRPDVPQPVPVVLIRTPYLPFTPVGIDVVGMVAELGG